MIVINFSHPITSKQCEQIESLTGRQINEIRDVRCQLDIDKPFPDQIHLLVNAAGLSSKEWQTQSIVVNPPAYSPAAVVLLAELHGRMGYFPPLIRIRPLRDIQPPQFEIGEIVNLQAVRDVARRIR